jgi:mannose-6-phosphate isomerase-like protein (cupin superfamily)
MAPEVDEIRNDRTGQRMRFLRGEDADDGNLRMETWIPPSGTSSEPLHVHPHQESGMTVLSGVLHFEIDGEPCVVHPSERVEIGRAVPHRFWNEGPDEVNALADFRPALGIEDFFRTYFALANDGRLDDHGRPSILQAAAFGPRFGDEIRLTSPPWWIQRVSYAVLAPLARVRGYR